MNKNTLTKILIYGFLFLYILIAGISFFHAIEFFNIGNAKWMSVALAIGFELGLSLSLAAVLLSEDNKRQTLPWILMVVLCIVQCCGNVYSTFKYISLSETEYYQYLAKPLLFFIEEVSPDTVQIIVSWIIGAILPIIALFMTDMVANNIKNLHKDNSEEKPLETNNEPEISPKEINTEVKKVEVKPTENDNSIHPPKVETSKEEKKEVVPPKTSKFINKIKEKVLPKKEKPTEDENIYKAQKAYYEQPYKEKEEN